MSVRLGQLDSGSETLAVLTLTVRLQLQVLNFRFFQDKCFSLGHRLLGVSLITERERERKRGKVCDCHWQGSTWPFRESVGELQKFNFYPKSHRLWFKAHLTKESVRYLTNTRLWNGFWKRVWPDEISELSDDSQQIVRTQPPNFRWDSCNLDLGSARIMVLIRCFILVFSSSIRCLRVADGASQKALI